MFILYIYKALEELRAARASASKCGLSLLGEKSSLNFHKAEGELIALKRHLTLSSTFKGSTGYDDYRARSLIVLEKLCYVIAMYHDAEKTFKSLGIEMAKEALDGHYWKAYNACFVAVKQLCMKDDEDYNTAVKIGRTLKTIKPDMYMHTASDLYQEYSAIATARLAALETLLNI